MYKTIALVLIAFSFSACHPKNHTETAKERFERRIQYDSTVVKFCGNHTYVVKLDDTYYMQEVDTGSYGTIGASVDLATICK